MGSQAAPETREHRHPPAGGDDLFGKNFVLLTGAGGQPWADAGRAVFAAAGIELRVCVVGEVVEGVAEAVTAAFGISTSGASLIRPDGVVAWRSASAAGDREGVMQQVVRTAIGGSVRSRDWPS